MHYSLIMAITVTFRTDRGTSEMPLVSDAQVEVVEGGVLQVHIPSANAIRFYAPGHWLEAKIDNEPYDVRDSML